MYVEENYLAHHGIKGMKRGVAHYTGVDQQIYQWMGTAASDAVSWGRNAIRDVRIGTKRMAGKMTIDDVLGR